MGVWFEPGRGHRFDFQLYGSRHRSPRGWETRQEALDAEAVLRRALKRQAGGLEPEPVAPPETPSFSVWAGVYLTWVQSQHALGRIKRPDEIEHTLSAVLRFWGRTPAEGYVHPGAPYHDLALGDPMADPSWLRRYDEWLVEDGIAGGTRNHYLSALSQMFKLALRAEYRDLAGNVKENPFINRGRARWKRRTGTLTPAQLTRWLEQMSYHTRLAVSIAALAPKFRLQNILQMRWDDIDDERKVITIDHHKTDASGQPLTTPLTGQLARILADARHRHPHAVRVILYRARPVKSIDTGLKAAALAAGLTWGRYEPRGVTFHSLRHSMSTLIARLKIHPLLHQSAMGHEDYATTLWYTHQDVDDEREPLEQLSEALPIETAVTRPGSRAVRVQRGDFSRRGESRGGSSRESGAKVADSGALRGLRRGPQTRKRKAVSA